MITGSTSLEKERSNCPPRPAERPVDDEVGDADARQRQQRHPERAEVEGEDPDDQQHGRDLDPEEVAVRDVGFGARPRQRPGDLHRFGAARLPEPGGEAFARPAAVRLRSARSGCRGRRPGSSRSSARRAGPACRSAAPRGSRFRLPCGRWRRCTGRPPRAAAAEKPCGRRATTIVRLISGSPKVFDRLFFDFDRLRGVRQQAFGVARFRLRRPRAAGSSR